MPVCVECGTAVTNLYTEYSKGNIRLTQCSNCNKFADKYVEHDFVIVFIDMLLHKPQVYRHLLFNRLEYRDQGLDPSVLKLGVLLVLFDVYIKWFRVEKMKDDPNDANSDLALAFMQQPLYYQYVYILTLCAVEFLAYQMSVIFAVKLCMGSRYAILKYNYITMTLILSSFGKMLLILMVIWSFHELEYSWLVSIFVFTSNVEALAVFLCTTYATTSAIALFGILVKVLVQVCFLRLTNSPLIISLLSF
ncbi:uncharacterized protein VTP21DRAFT_6956 [Calcarisporiella thermophila]|uniref:uncharacterized protein n=1 Tax=Calcarisporiella thermophila TaxID=911321 RepID=UPI003742E084